jgi:pimeloyl-ACP methyl ester carboxylesterase
MKHLLLLHGALGAADQFDALKAELLNSFNLHSPNFSGHGGKPFAGDFCIQAFAQEILDFLTENKIEKTDVFGYSMGGYVALYLALTNPERIGKVMTLATKFDWTPESAAREVKMLDPEKIEAKVPAFAAALSARHAPNDWKELLRHAADLMTALGNNNLLTVNALSQITCPALICRGELDQMVSEEETRLAAEALPNGKMLTLEATPHPLEKVEMGRVGEVVKAFFD